MDSVLSAQVMQEVNAWLAWLPRWQPGSHRGRVRVCRTCFGSPILSSAGLLDDMPHGVQHPFSMRMKSIIDRSVDDYTAKNLPLLHHELAAADARKAKRKFSAGDGLDPEYQGLALDPEPQPGQPFLFTFDELERDSVEPAPAAAEPLPLTEDQKTALRREIQLVDEYSTALGRELCTELLLHQGRIARAVIECVEPQVSRLLADLERELEWPLRG